jgi:hypothetical protein
MAALMHPVATNLGIEPERRTIRKLSGRSEVDGMGKRIINRGKRRFNHHPISRCTVVGENTRFALVFGAIAMFHPFLDKIAIISAGAQACSFCANRRSKDLRFEKSK